MTVLLPKAHKAVLVVTGWASRKEGRDLVAGVWVRALPEKFHGTRVTVRLYPSTSTRGTLNGPQLYGHVRPAREPNGQTLEIIARLIRADVADNLLLLQVFPSQNNALPFKLSVRATTDVLRRVDPEWPALRLTGSLISDLLVADQVERVYAPVPERWDGWVRGRPPKRSGLETGERREAPPIAASR
ncbi:hypothetical protein [Deinococcus sp. UYEF24]